MPVISELDRNISPYLNMYQFNISSCAMRRYKEIQENRQI